MHVGHAAKDPTHRTAGAPEPTDLPPTRREAAARAAAPTSLAGRAPVLFPKTDATATVLCAAIRSRVEEVPPDGGEGGLSIDVDHVSSLRALANTLGARSPLDSRKGQRDVWDPHAPASGGTLSTTLTAPPPPPPRQAGHLFAPARPRVDCGLPGVGICTPPPP